MHRAIFFLLIAVGLLVPTSPANACPNCQAGVASEADDEALSAGLGNPALGYNMSVLFMMSMPFLLVAGFATAFYRLYRQQQQQLSHASPQATLTEATREHSACPRG